MGGGGERTAADVSSGVDPGAREEAGRSTGAAAGPVARPALEADGGRPGRRETMPRAGGGGARASFFRGRPGPLGAVSALRAAASLEVGLRVAGVGADTPAGGEARVAALGPITGSGTMVEATVWAAAEGEAPSTEAAEASVLEAALPLAAAAFGLGVALGLGTAFGLGGAFDFGAAFGLGVALAPSLGLSALATGGAGAGTPGTGASGTGASEAGSLETTDADAIEEGWGPAAARTSGSGTGPGMGASSEEEESLSISEEERPEEDVEECAAGKEASTGPSEGLIGTMCGPPSPSAGSAAGASDTMPATTEGRRDRDTGDGGVDSD